MTLVSTDWLNDNLNKVKIIDASWHLVKNRNAIEEYNKEHIKNAIFFDLDPDFVSFHHIIRLLMILFIVPLMLKIIAKKNLI